MPQAGREGNSSPGWVLDESGAWRRETIHHMGRRCRNWDYRGTGVYMITMVLNDRRSAAFGHVSGPEGEMMPTPLGAAVAAHAWRMAEFTPEIKVLGVQIMPDHLHAVLWVRRRLAKPLGEHLRGFKIGCTKIARSLSAIDGGAPETAHRGAGLFADGFVDTILGSREAVDKALAYLADNPRRLWQKRAHPELFCVIRDFTLRLPIDGKARIAHFAALGNHHLLERPHLIQVQCSRRDFAYARNASGELLKDDPPALATPAFEELAADLLAAAAHGAVLVSPCLSQGEKELTRRAIAAGGSVVSLQNKGFNPLYKPGGKLFNLCAEGHLFLLAPRAWPYLPGRKPITRTDACTLNRIAQLLSGTGAAEISYRGMTPCGVERLVAEAVQAEIPMP